VTRAGQRILTYHRGLCRSHSTTKFSRAYGLGVNLGSKVETFVQLKMGDNIDIFESVLPSNPYT
jgi:hypothetical protein